MIVEEASEIRYGRTTIEYGIRRSSRRTTVAVAVDPVEGVMLTAPRGVDVARLDRVVRDKARWILERLRLVQDGERAPEPRRFVTGESFQYLGRHYRLRVRAAAHPAPAKLEGGWLVVGVDRRLEGPSRAQAVESAIRSWYIGHAHERLTERAHTWADKAGLDVTNVVVKDQHKRWASCDGKGVLRFNWRVIQAPMRLVDYVVAHEIVHLVHRDHTKAFWGRLGVLMPDYERRKAELRRIGSTMEWG